MPAMQCNVSDNDAGSHGSHLRWAGARSSCTRRSCSTLSSAEAAAAELSTDTTTGFSCAASEARSRGAAPAGVLVSEYNDNLYHTSHSLTSRDYLGSLLQTQLPEWKPQDLHLHPPPYHAVSRPSYDPDPT